MITPNSIIYITYWLLFGFIHSLLAYKQIKSSFSSKLGSEQLYRLIYNLVNTLTLIIVIVLLPFPDKLILSILQPDKHILGTIIIMIGLSILLFGLYKWDISGFLGLTDETANRELVTSGVYRFSRHPVYTGIIIVFVGLFVMQISDFSFSLLIGGSGYFIIGTYLEEKKLEQTFGKKYLQYQENVARFVPYKFSHLRYLLSGELDQ